MHKMLLRQIKKSFGKDVQIDKLPPEIQDFIARVDSSYRDGDQKIEMLDKALKNSSEDLTRSNQEIINKTHELNEQQLKQERNRSSIIFNHQENAVVITTPENGLEEANQAFYKTFGFEDFDAFKKDYFCICELFEEKDGYLKGSTEEAYWSQIVAENPDKLHRALIRNAKGKLCIYKVQSRYIDIDDRNSVLSTFTDITESENLRLRAEEIKEAKSTFLANMSHEIRTPLNGLSGFVQLLGETNLDEEQKRYITVAQNSVNTLLSVVNDILDYSKIENEKIETNNQPFDLHALFTALYETFIPIAEKKRIIYTMNIDAHITPCLVSDRLHLSKILQNFISNALKFTPKRGAVCITVSLVSQKKNYQRVRFEVRDTGIGIKKEKINTIMQPFSQADISITRDFGGTGLGLSISKSLISLLNGELKVESEEGQGSIFSFEIDMDTCTLSQQNELEEIKAKEVQKPSVNENKYDYSSGDGSDYRILIAEDIETNRMFIGMFLEGFKGISYEFANNGKKAVEKLKQQNYDLILMDINMPVMSGIDATIHIRNILKLKTPIVALTANALKGDKEWFLAMGMDDYLSKPLELEAVKKILQRYR